MLRSVVALGRRLMPAEGLRPFARVPAKCGGKRAGLRQTPRLPSDGHLGSARLDQPTCGLTARRVLRDTERTCQRRQVANAVDLWPPCAGRRDRTLGNLLTLNDCA